MGGEGFMEKLKMLFGGGSAPPTEPTPEGKPWEQPMSGAPPAGFHRMPDGSLMRDAAMPSPSPSPMAPGSVSDDPMALAVELARKREMVKKMVPDFVNR